MNEVITRIRIQNFLLVWLDGSSDGDNFESIKQLRQIVNNVNQFTDVDDCITFIDAISDEKIFLILPGYLGQRIIPILHDKSQISTIYILCGNCKRHESWTKKWMKIKGIYTDLTPICQALKSDVYECDQNSISISLLKESNRNLNELDQSFMYSQILKEILLSIDFNDEHFREFIIYCRQQFIGNAFELNNIDKLENEYRTSQAIWWYTYGSFLYSTLNYALRTMEVDIIVKMGFFIRDLHNNLAKLHSEQFSEPTSFVVYRGQGLSQMNFDQLQKTKGGLLAFNNYLSTSKIRRVSLSFAQQTTSMSGFVGVLFVMKIDSSILSTPYANVRDVSAYQTEEEILFSMHSIFRIGEIKSIDKNDRVWEVELTLTGDNDPQLHELTERIRNDLEGSNGWIRLAKLMGKLGQQMKAESLFKILLEQVNNDEEKGNIFYELGLTQLNQAKYTEAIESYQQSTDIREKYLPSKHSLIAKCYNSIGHVYDCMGEYTKALTYHENALEIFQDILTLDDHELGGSYAYLANTYKFLGNYSKALTYFEKALEIYEKTLPSNHPSLGTMYGQIGNVYTALSDPTKALEYHEKANKVLQKTLPPDHPDLATSYGCIGNFYVQMGNCEKALSYYEQCLEIYQKTLPEDHPSIANSNTNIGYVYVRLSDFTKAFTYAEKALKIRENKFTHDHPDLEISYTQLGTIYTYLGDYTKALDYYEKANEILQKNLPADHQNLATSYVFIGNIHVQLGDLTNALSYYEKAYEIYQKILPTNHSDLVNIHLVLGDIYFRLDQHSKALNYYETVLNSCQDSLPSDHPTIQRIQQNIETIKQKE